MVVARCGCACEGAGGKVVAVVQELHVQLTKSVCIGQPCVPSLIAIHAIGLRASRPCAGQPAAGGRHGCAPGLFPGTPRGHEPDTHPAPCLAHSIQAADMK